MRTTLTLDDALYERARSIASLSGKRLGEVISQLALAGLEQSADERASFLPPTLDHGRKTKVNLAALQKALEDLP